MPRKRIDFSIREINLLIYRKVFSVTVFLFLYGVFLLSFYLIGNYKNFLDESQNIILLCLSFISVLLIFLSVFEIVENPIFLIKRIKIINRFISIFWMIFFALSGIVMFVFSYAVNYLAEGLFL